ncbi:MAG: ABC transporter permease subunit [Alphaproteobacteria bacterium]|nr:ABC transporter permease subunit [Alphaproteobacteria bacterium]MBL6777148.1 ABC transporter permease subunit [Alphaproteobacteria bacterium]
MSEFLSTHRADVAALLIIILTGLFVWSIYYGLRRTRKLDSEQVFGDPERTLGGWFWAVCGVSSLLLVWFYFSWGTARAFFPSAANEMCQVAKIDEALSPITAKLPYGDRYYKSTELLVRNGQQLAALEAQMPAGVYSSAEQKKLFSILDRNQQLLTIYSDSAQQSPSTGADLDAIHLRLQGLSEAIDAGYAGLMPTAEALAQPRWGVTDSEIPMLPLTPRGVLFDNVAEQSKEIAKDFVKVRNLPEAAKIIISGVKSDITSLKEADKNYSGSEADLASRKAYLKAVERIFKRLDDGAIFPAAAMMQINLDILQIQDSVKSQTKGLRLVDALFLPGEGVVKSRTLCVEQGSSRWLPKPTDVVAKFARLANPNLEDGGGYKGTVLFWWKWLEIADVIAFLIPDGVVDMLPGDYGIHNDNGEFVKTYKDHLLAVAQGDVYLGVVPMLDGHIWDSVFRVIVAMGFGIALGVPLGIYMGVSRFFKSFFDPLIELYRPVPPLAWAPLILTIFGIQDDGKIFLLFMVAFAIMVISARTGASGTQLSKIRASHSLGATNKQIIRYVILPNALPEILTGIRISIGVCWGTLVAAEMLAGTTGIGFIENVARTVSDYELIWVTILIMGLLGLLFDIAMRFTISVLIPWRGKG